MDTNGHISDFLSLTFDPFGPPEGCLKISGITGEAQGAMRQIHSAAVTAGPDLTFAPASNFAAESPAALSGHRKILQMTFRCFITKARQLHH